MIDCLAVCVRSKESCALIGWLIRIQGADWLSVTGAMNPALWLADWIESRVLIGCLCQEPAVAPPLLSPLPQPHPWPASEVTTHRFTEYSNLHHQAKKIHFFFTSQCQRKKTKSRLPKKLANIQTPQHFWDDIFFPVNTTRIQKNYIFGWKTHPPDLS